MNQVLAGNIDSLETVMVYRYELDSVVVRLEDAQRQNTVLAVMLVCLFVLSVLVVIYLVRRHREKMRSGDLANRLLKQQAAAMPYFTERVNSLSAKGIKLSGKLYEEFQAAIDDVKRLASWLQQDATDWIAQMKDLRDGHVGDISLLPENDRRNKFCLL